MKQILTLILLWLDLLECEHVRELLRVWKALGELCIQVSLLIRRPGVGFSFGSVGFKASVDAR